nr:TonB-dependent receptor [Sandaracinobacteroides sayramensis]
MRACRLFVALLGASVLYPAVALAQDAASQGDQVPAETDETALGGGDIVVTGSRIVRDGYTAPTPVTVARMDDLMRSTPSSAPDALNRLPQFSQSSSPSRSTQNFANTASIGNILNLRGLGGNRTLILLDGVRTPPTTFTGAVDVNIMPNLLLERVDIVTGGASAAYGSDAVAGVVNFVLNRKFEGITGLAQTGISQRGDNANYRIGAAGGFRFGPEKAGHILLSAEHSNNDGMLRNEREIGRGGHIFAGSTRNCVPPTGQPASVCNPGGSANPYKVYPDGRLTVAADDGLILGYSGGGDFAYLNHRFTREGGLVPFNPGTPTGSPIFSSGGDGYAIPNDVTTIAPLKTTQLFGRVSYDFSPSITAYAQGNWSRSELNYTSLANSWTGTTNAPLYKDNPFLPSAVNDAMADGSFITVGMYNGGGAKPHTEERTDFWMATGGLEGSFGSDWKWNVAYTHGDSRHRMDQSGVYDWQKAYAAIDAVRDGSGQIVCRPTLDPDPAIRARFADCRPLNIIGQNGILETPDGYAYATGTSSYRANIRQDSAIASLQGSLFELPAGPVDIAVGGEWRRQKLSLTSNANPALLDTEAERNAWFAGLRGVSSSALFFWLTNVGEAEGSVNVKEAFAEVNVPVLKDVPFFQSLELNAAGRITDYSTSGTVKTWKLGGTWRPVSDLLLRGTVSRDIRAPTLFDLFAGDQSSIGLVYDPVTDTQGNVNQVQGGNPLLKPEVAKTWTVGGAFTPSFAPGLSLSVDYYRIKIDGAIGTLGAGQIVNNCQASGGTAPECALITRPSPTSFPSLIRLAPANIAALETSGIDIDASYRTELGGGTLSTRLYLAWLERYRTQQFSGAPVYEFSGYSSSGNQPIGRPKWRGTLNVGWEKSGFGLFWTQQYIGGSDIGSPEAFNDFNGARIKSVWYTDLTLSKKIRHGEAELETFLTINNLFDKDPPLVPGTIPGLNLPTIISLYDTVGRSFTAGVRFRF